MARTRLTSLGRTVAELEDVAIAARERPPVERRLASIHAEIERRRSERATSLRRPIAIGAAIGAVAAALLLWPRAEPLHFAVGEEPAPGALGVWVAAPRDGATPIHFSDGTRVLLGAGARARIVEVRGHGAKVVVERGTVRADVVPRDGNDWSVLGGPFEIHVTGTSFDASWDPEREELHVAMYEGKVIVRGPCLASERTLARGESATLSCAEGGVAAGPRPRGSREAAVQPAEPSDPIEVEAAPPALASAHAASGSSAEVAASTRPSAPVAATPETHAAAPSAVASPSPPSLSWLALAARGDYKQALAAAEAEDFAALCASLPEAELLELATAARLAGRSQRAREAYTAIRRRFAGSDAAAVAAFHLGQAAFDGAHAFVEAHRWFTVYLTERPTGVLAAEALGRAMEAEQASGDLGAARATAAAYLSRFPTGAHAAIAKSLLAP